MITALIEAVDRNTALLVEAITRRPPPIVSAREIVREVRVESPQEPDSIIEAVNQSVKSPVKSVYTLQQEIMPVATPSKEELARQYLANHKKHRAESSRWLSEHIKPQGVKISHVTWNKIKKEFTD